MAEEYAAALELGEIHLHVERDNHGARRLYQRRGFGVLAEQGARLLLGKKL
ncbi:MAG: GNAT family N-acetyltransferase [Acutalibacter sp.]